MHLSPSIGKTVILVLIDRLTKPTHFITLVPHFTALQVAEIFIKEIVRLHSVLTSVTSDRDPLFMNLFWRELFRL